MMNVLALSLVLTTLVTAGVFSPKPGKENHKDDVIVKEGHRTVVVEFENDDRSNTRVFISSQEAQGLHKSAKANGEGHGDGSSSIRDKISDKVEGAKEKIKEVASDNLPDVGRVSSSEKDKDSHGHRHWVSPRELVCDAYGKCKHKIASALGKTKDKVYEKVDEVGEKIHEVQEGLKEEVGDAYDKVKDTVREKSSEVSDKAHDAKEKVRHGASEVSGKAKEAFKEGAKEKTEEIKRGAKELVDICKTIKEDVEKNASKTMEITKNKVAEKAREAEELYEQSAEEAKHGAQRLKEEGKKDLKVILRRGREVVSDAFSDVVSQENMAASLQLLGFATAFGTSIWVTFISSYVLAGTLPRQQFGMVQSKIYPAYFKVMAYSIGATLAGHLLSRRRTLSSDTAEMLQCFNLLASLVMVLPNLFILEPRATKVMFERMKMEKEDGRGKEGSRAAVDQTTRLVDSFTGPAVTRAAAAELPSETTAAGPGQTIERRGNTASSAELVRLSQKLKKLNLVSSFLNISTLLALTWHLVHLGQSLH